MIGAMSLALVCVASSPTIPSSATAQQLWVVTATTTDETLRSQLCVLPLAGDALVALRTLHAPTLQLASNGTSVWVLSERSGRSDVVDVLGLSAKWNNTASRWVMTPSQGFDLLPSMTCNGAPQLASTDTGPWLASVGDEVQLYRLDAGRWVDVVLPEMKPMRQTFLLGGGRRPVLVAQDEEGVLHVTRPTGEAHWHTTTASKVPPIDAAVAADGRTILVHERDGTLQCLTLVGDTAQPLTSMSIGQTWGVSMAGQTLSVLRGGDEGLEVLRVDVTRPSDTPQWIALRVDQPAPADMWSFVISIGIAAAVISMLLRTGKVSPMALLQQGPPLGLGRRLIAVGFDAVVPAFIVVLAMGVHPSHLIRLPLMGMQPASLDAAVFWALGTGVWVALWTGKTGTTPGLKLMGGGVVNALGGRPGRGAVIRRGLLLALVLLTPPLALLVLLGPGRMSLADTISRTRVVQRGK